MQRQRHWERLSELVAYWHSWLFLTNCETWIMTLRVSDWQSENDLDSIRNSSDVFVSLYIFIYKDFYSFVFSRTSISPQPQQGSLLCSAIFASEHIVSWVRQSTTFSVNKLISVFINFREIYHRSCYPLPIHPKNSFRKKRKCFVFLVFTFNQIPCQGGQATFSSLNL